VQKVGEMRLSSPQIGEQREMPAEGRMYIAARGPGLKAGETLSMTISGLPHPTTWPRNLAIALVLVIAAGGVWGSLRTAPPAAPAAARRTRLEASRERLFGELTALENQHRDKTIDPERYTTRRRELVTALERVYAELDEEAAA
jgi:hypothetical protein